MGLKLAFSVLHTQVHVYTSVHERWCTQISLQTTTYHRETEKMISIYLESGFKLGRIFISSPNFFVLSFSSHSYYTQIKGPDQIVDILDQGEIDLQD